MVTLLLACLLLYYHFSQQMVERRVWVSRLARQRILLKICLESLNSYFGGEYKGHVSLPWTDNQLRILIFYVATVLLIGLNGDIENLSL